MTRFRWAFAALLLGAPDLALAAGGPPDPDWPCIQRRQPRLSVAQLWSGPQPDAATEARARERAVQAVAQAIALRRTSMEEAKLLIAEFADARPPEARAGDLAALFLGTFDLIQSQRDRTMGGITRYAHKQEALDRLINDKRQAFAAMTAAESPDFDAVDKLEAEIDWSTRIFVDRQQSLTYVCETAVILEQRAFALGREIAAHLPK